MKRIVFSIAVSFLLFSCQGRISEQTKLVYQLTDNFSKDLKNKENFRLVARGGVFCPTVHSIALGYRVCRKTDLQEARKLLVKYVEELLKDVNGSEKLRPYLENYPCTPYELHFTISFTDKNGHELIDGSIASICLFGFNNPKTTYVHYDIYDSEKHNWVDIHVESYEEAKKIVRAEG